MSAKRNELTSEIWQSAPTDPNLWLVIPEFDVKPVDVAFAGFAFPLVGKGENAQTKRVKIISELVGLIRTKIREHFKSVADLRAASGPAIRIVCPRDGSAPKKADIDRLSKQDIQAVFYNFTLHALWMAASDDYHPGIPKEPGYAALRLAQACLWIARWNNNDVAALVKAARRDLARKGAAAKHDATRRARVWVWNEWLNRRAEFKDNKSKFAVVYQVAIRSKFQDAEGFPVKVEQRTISETWLRGPPPASKQAGLPADGE